MPHRFILARSIEKAFVFLVLAMLPAPAHSDEAMWIAAQRAADAHDYRSAIGHATAHISQGQYEPTVYYYRGRWNFLDGNIDASLADFDKFIQLRPEFASRLWERGITCYYAGAFAEGDKQFQAYQTYHSNDVENAVWRYLCQAQLVGRAKARQEMLPIRRDTRVPMMQIYDLFRGRAEPRDVLTRVPTADDDASERIKAQRLHGHLYLALYFDSEGDQEAAQKHIDLAVGVYPVGPYMWAVAKQHQQYLATRRESTKQAPQPATDRKE